MLKEPNFILLTIQDLAATYTAALKVQVNKTVFLIQDLISNTWLECM